MAQAPGQILDLAAAMNAFAQVLQAFAGQQQPNNQQNNPSDAVIPVPRLQNAAAINGHRNLLPDNHQALNIMQIICTHTDLPANDRDNLFDLLQKQFYEHHLLPEIPSHNWKQKWYKSIFNSNWNSSIYSTSVTQIIKKARS
ncbi:hypothetical protein EAE96_007522 [Botrytis aclada]|nr:hypothetical protein EAE96_007522 [Botrytis aclada]